MKKLLALVVTLALAACGPVAPNPYGIRTVSPGNCRDPQSAYAGDVTLLNQLGLSTFVLGGVDGGVDVTLSCDDFNSDCLDFHIQRACDAHAANAAGFYDLTDTSTVHIDPAQANGEFAFSAVVNHELIHWYIAQGPHPERARMHVCPCGMVSAECWADGCGAVTLMAPSFNPAGSAWSGDTESVDPGAIPLNHPVDLDVRFVAWATAP